MIVPVIDVRETEFRRPGAILLARLMIVAATMASAAAAGAWVGRLG